MIRVTRTEVWEYDPDLEDDFYVEHECKDIEQAMKADKEFYDSGKGGLDEIATDIPDVSTVWELIV